MLAAGAALLLLGACGPKQVDPTRLPADDLYQRATEAYEARKFDRAIPFLEVFATQHLGDPRAPRARLLLGRAHMEKREYITAATHFQRLLEDFPTSEFGLEARFAICESYVELSPRPQLDQEYTQAALAHCQSVSENFPGTPESERATTLVTDMRDKLAEKAYLTGKFYQRRKAFDAAIVYFEDVVTQFPTTEYAPAALLDLVDTYETLGYEEEAEEARERLRNEYPQSSQAQALRS